MNQGTSCGGGITGGRAGPHRMAGPEDRPAEPEHPGRRRDRLAMMLRDTDMPVLWLATEACQVQGEDAYDGHLVLRLLAGLVLLYTARMVFQGRVTIEAIVFSLKHHWRFLHSEPLE